MPLAEQPVIVADMGCGDGTLLKTIYLYVINWRPSDSFKHRRRHGNSIDIARSDIAEP